MTVPEHEDLEFFESLDDLQIADDSAMPVKSLMNTERTDEFHPKSMIDDRSDINQTRASTQTKRSTGTRPIQSGLRGTRHRAVPKEPSSEDAAFALLMTEATSSAPARAQEVAVQSSSHSNAFSPPRTSERSNPEAISVSKRTSSHPSIRMVGVVFLCATAVAAAVLLAGRYTSASSNAVSGNVKFIPPNTPIAFVQLLRLNSPREEQYVAEIKDGQFQFGNVLPGSFVLWFATSDGTPISCHPTGSSIGKLKKTDQYLEIEITEQSPRLGIEVEFRQDE